MDADEARRRLDAERARLVDIKDNFDEEHLTDETEDESLSELSGMDQHQAAAEQQAARARPE